MPSAVQTFEFRIDPENAPVAVAIPSFVPMDWAFIPAKENGVPARNDNPPSNGALNYQCALVLITNEGSRLRSVDVTFTERMVGGGHSTIIGFDKTGSLQAVVDADLPRRTCALKVRFDPHTMATPNDLLAPLELLEALSPGLLLGLWSYSTSRWATEPVTIPAVLPGAPDGYSDTVRTLARIQRATRVDFPMPQNITEVDAKAIRIASVLLDGGVVRGTWTSVLLTLDRASVESIQAAAGPYGALFEFTTGYVLNLNGHPIPLGPVEYRLMQVFLGEVGDPVSDDEWSVALTPGSNTAFELVRVGGRPRPTESLSTTGLDAHLGRWIAQEGEEIVVSGDSPEEVFRTLKLQGRSGSIWRVPASKDEADSALIGL